MASCHSDVAGQIKQMLEMREVAERYGFTPDRGGFIRCPFHQGDNHGSLKLYPGSRGWHCFGCNSGGDVIRFVMLLFDLTFRQAVVRISADFGLRLTSETPDRQAVSERILARQRGERMRAEFDAEYRAVAAIYQNYHEIVMLFQPLLMSNGKLWVHPLYEEAVKAMPRIAWWLDKNIGR